MELKRTHSGLTLIEIMAAIAVLVVGVLGAMMYRYNAALDARKADVLIGAERVGLLILQGWKGAAGSATYDPQGVGGVGTEVLGSSDLDISAENAGVHTVRIAGTSIYYYVKLTKPPIDLINADLNGDGVIDTTNIRKLEVEVKYYGRGSNNTNLPSKSIKFCDYVRTN